MLAVPVLDRALEVDRVSRAARVQAGASGPVLEEQLGESPSRDRGPTVAVIGRRRW